MIFFTVIGEQKAIKPKGILVSRNDVGNTTEMIWLIARGLLYLNALVLPTQTSKN